jgi:TolB-like protein/Flp pilus assembly protein TadD
MLPNSVAVLPFANMSPNPDDAYFAAGIHEEILNYLAKLSELNVIGRTSVLRYANTELSLREIAAELNVETIMEGSVRYAGDQVRITAQLIDPATGAHLWSEAYQRKIEDIFAIQADIAMNIANAIGAEFSVAEQTALARPLTSSPAAYALYLQAADVFRSGGGADLGHALLDRAIAIDPGFALAYARKANLYASTFVNSVQGTAVPVADRAVLEQSVRENAEKAMSIDPTDPRGREGLLLLNALTWRWADYAETIDAAAERTLVGAAQLALSWMGRSADALRVAQKVAELDPNDAQAHVNLGVAQAYAGDRAASNRSFERALELSSTTVLARTWLAYNAIAVGDNETALGELQVLERALGASPPFIFLPELAYAYSRLGRNDDVARLVAAIESRADADGGAGTWAMVSLARGDEREALRWLEVGAEKARNHEPDPGIIQLMNLKMNFLADPRLEEPRLAEVLSRIRGD